MPRRRIRSLLVVTVCCVALQPAGFLLAESMDESVASRLVEVGLAIERQIELAQVNHERGTLDQATLERQADAAEKALQNLERRIHSLPDGATDELMTKLHAVQAQAANLARAAELGTAPPRRQSETTRVKHLNRRGGGTRAIPANDNCEDAFPAVIGGAYAGDTTEATNDGEAVCGASLTSPDVWYRFVPTEPGVIVAETLGSTYDTVLSVHWDCPGTMSNQIVCSDDSVGLHSSVVFNAYVGSEYLIRVSGSNQAVGAYTLSLATAGRIEGSVTDAATASPIRTYVEAFDGAGFQVASDYTDATGDYSVGGLGTNEYFLATDNSYGFFDELYDGHPCTGGPPHGCDPATGDSVSVTVGGVVSGIDFVLDRGGVVTGQIRDQATTDPIEDARVNIYNGDEYLVAWSWADAAGEFRFDNLTPGTYTVWTDVSTHKGELFDDVSCPVEPPAGCSFAAATPILVAINSTVSGIDFDLEKLGSITGTVVDRTTGLAISGADVEVFNIFGTYIKDSGTVSNGTYEVGGLADGTYYLTVRRSYNYVKQLFDGIDCSPFGCSVLSGTPVTVVGQGTTAGVDFDLVEKGRISGLVVDETTGLPIQGIRVRVYSQSGSSAGYDSTSSSGEFIVDELNAGSYFVATDDTDYLNELYDDLPCPASCDPTSGTPVTVVDGEKTTGIDFSIVAKGMITGTLTEEGTGELLYMRVQLFDSVGAFLEYDTASQGVYEFTGLDDGQYFVLAKDPYGSIYLGELFDDIPCWEGPPSGCTLTDGTPVISAAGVATTGIDFALYRGGSISGTVTESLTTVPVTGQAVYVRQTGGSDFSSASLNSNGEYEVEGLPPGDYVAVVNARDHRDEVWDALPCVSDYPDGCDLGAGTPIPVSIATGTAGIDFSLDRLGSVSGVVRSAATGSALSSVRIEISDVLGSVVGYDYTEEFGNYRVDGLWPGDRFAVTNKGYGYWVDQLFDGIPCPGGPLVGCVPNLGTPLAVGADTQFRWVDFLLDVTGTISGHVIDNETGLPLAGVRVEAWSADGQLRDDRDTGLDGSYRLYYLETGTFFVVTDEYGSYQPDYIDTLYDGIPCPSGPPEGCDPTKGTPVTVVGGLDTDGIDLALPRRSGGITGMVSALEGGVPIAEAQIDVWASPQGGYVTGIRTSAAGTFVLDLYPGTYVVTTDNSGAWVNQIFDGIVCPVGSAYHGDCDPMTGDVVTVTDDELTTDIDFILEASPALFVDGFESGSAVRWTATVP